MKSYDIAMIGAGSGGLTAATSAHRQGAKVALIEKDKIGGECTHSGCVPSKTFLHVSKVFHAAQQAEQLGLPRMTPATDPDFARVMEHVNSVVQEIYEHEKPKVWQDMGIDVFVDPAGAKFLDAHTIRVGDQTVGAAHAIVCTGSSRRMTPIKGHREGDILSNENFWQARRMPDAVLFLGGGVISAELGQALARLGCQVSIVDRNPRILKILDDDVAEVAIRVLQDDGIDIRVNSQVTLCELQADGRNTVYVERAGRQERLDTDAVLFAALGRVPNVAGLDLENAGVAYDSRAGIQTNEYLQTTAGNIYAAGDVTSAMKFTHVAAQQAETCVANILEGNHKLNDLSIVPWAIFMEPEVAHVGLSEAQARSHHPGVQVFRVDATIDRFITESKTTGFLKVVMDENDGILGADAIGAHSGEWIQLIALAMKHKVPITSFGETIFAYPTFSEIVKKAFTRFLRTKR